MIAKRLDSKYRAGERSKFWLKLPLKPGQDFVIGAYRLDGNRLELLLVGYFENGKLLFAGKVHQGLNPANRRALLKVLQPLGIGKCPFANLPTSKKSHWGEGVIADEMGDYIWLRPEIVAEIKFAEWTKGGVLRHAEFVTLRDRYGSKRDNPREFGLDWPPSTIGCCRMRFGREGLCTGEQCSNKDFVGVGRSRSTIPLGGFPSSAWTPKGSPVRNFGCFHLEARVAIRES